MRWTMSSADRAEEFAAAVDDRSANASSAHGDEYAEFLGLVSQLRDIEQPVLRPDFAADLRERLMDERPRRWPSGTVSRAEPAGELPGQSRVARRLPPSRPPPSCSAARPASPPPASPRCPARPSTRSSAASRTSSSPSPGPTTARAASPSTRRAPTRRGHRPDRRPRRRPAHAGPGPRHPRRLRDSRPTTAPDSLIESYR